MRKKKKFNTDRYKSDTGYGHWGMERCINKCNFTFTRTGVQLIMRSALTHKIWHIQCRIRKLSLDTSLTCSQIDTCTMHILLTLNIFSKWSLKSSGNCLRHWYTGIGGDGDIDVITLHISIVGLEPNRVVAETVYWVIGQKCRIIWNKVNYW